MFAVVARLPEGPGHRGIRHLPRPQARQVDAGQAVEPEHHAGGVADHDRLVDEVEHSLRQLPPGTARVSPSPPCAPGLRARVRVTGPVPREDGPGTSRNAGGLADRCTSRTHRRFTP